MRYGKTKVTFVSTHWTLWLGPVHSTMMARAFVPEGGRAPMPLATKAELFGSSPACPGGQPPGDTMNGALLVSGPAIPWSVATSLIRMLEDWNGAPPLLNTRKVAVATPPQSWILVNSAWKLGVPEATGGGGGSTTGTDVTSPITWVVLPHTQHFVPGFFGFSICHQVWSGLVAQHHRLLSHQQKRDRRVLRAGTGAAVRLHVGADLWQLGRQRRYRWDGCGRRLSLGGRRLRAAPAVGSPPAGSPAVAWAGAPPESAPGRSAAPIGPSW